VRRDPMAMLPFCGYHMGDYFTHWLEMGKKLANPPKIFNVNWFRTDSQGNFIWPGFGENLRVLLWILGRCSGAADAEKTAIGYLPSEGAIDIEGLDGVDAGVIKELLTVDTELWKQEAAGIEEFYAKFDRMPDELRDELAGLKKRLG